MILRILTLVCAICIYPALGRMDMGKFMKNFEDMCFQNEQSDPFRVNGQETPLSSTLENFISLAEKFEAANPSLDLKEELVYFISEYVFENIKIINGNIDQWKVGRSNFKIINSMWDPDVNGYKPSFVVPFSDDEKCSLYYMISHSILSKDVQLLRSYVPGNFSSSNSNGARTVELEPDDYRPQELGVVAIRGTNVAVSLSKVLIGLFVGLKPDRKTDLTSYDSFQDLNVDAEDLPQDTTVDALFAVTLAEILMLSNWTGNDRPGLAKNGNWVSIPLNFDKKIDGFCPMVYVQQPLDPFVSGYSYSSVRGAADGLILGLAAQDVYRRKPSTKLSQILRMYYSPDGITVDTQLEEINTKRISFCGRNDAVAFLERKLQDQMLLYGYLIAQSGKDVVAGFQKGKEQYAKDKGNIFVNDNAEIRDYCDRPTSLDKPEDLPREIFLDVIVVMDSSNTENAFQEQQIITGHLAKHLDLRYTGSRMTILVDHKVTSSSARTSRVQLKAIVPDTYSSSCAACMVGQIGYEPSTLERDQLVTGIDHFLQERKENETKFNGVNGKVVIYFNYENDDGRGNSKIQGRLEKALRDLHLNHLDVAFYAVGLDSKLLQKYAKNDPSLVFLGTDGTQEEVGKRLFNKISFAPALLQYADCKEAKNEKAATYDNFVSPHTIQHYEMPAEYYYKSRSLTFTFESSNGYIRVCHNRATSRPENEIRNCKNTTGNVGIEFKLSNPCQGFTKETCSPFYFSVMGMESNSQEMRQDTRIRDYCNDIHDQWCRTLDQVKFKVSHTGVRCNGCLGLGAPPAVILFTVLLTYFIYKRF